jgi:RNA polymerase sigma-70 factor (ECF subfamily)
VETAQAMTTPDTRHAAVRARLIGWHEQWGGAVARLVAASEANPAHRQDLEQEVWIALWRALPQFEGRCSDRTFVFRVAHNVAATAALKGARDWLKRAVPLEDVQLDDGLDREAALDQQKQLARLHSLIARLLPLDRETLLLWLEGLPAAEIAQVTGLSASHVATKVHRIKALLLKQHHQETPQ